MSTVLRLHHIVNIGSYLTFFWQNFTSPLNQLQNRIWLMHWSLFIFFNHENDRKELLFLSLEKNCCWGVTFCNNAFGYLIKLHYTWTVLTICFLFPDHWLLLEEVQHWIVWAAEQNCTNSRNFTYYAGPLCRLLPQWVIIVELQFFRRGHCKL